MHSANDRFHRRESPTQTADLARVQVASAKVCGRTPRGGNVPTVQAYRGALPVGVRGIEFSTDVPPTAGTGTPYEARWRAGSPGVSAESDDLVCIPVRIQRNTQQP